MTATPDLADRYLAAWNETDPATRRALIAEVFAEDVTYTDPMADVAGHDGLDATIAAVHGMFPGFVFRLAGQADAHHDQVRFTWHLGPEGVEAPVIGSDVAVTGADGRIRTVLGFLDRVPASA
ncbi:nuclear transport factor 2 family protein [Geodermatophilus amargosae]|uniref:nuclear transport factor 2 family protein n=1 Tax=Geodermatophilus amargosae TaxID=1296565 RepID=UPI0034DFB975